MESVHVFIVWVSRLLDLLDVLCDDVVESGQMIASLHQDNADIDELLLVDVNDRSKNSKT